MSSRFGPIIRRPQTKAQQRALRSVQRHAQQRRGLTPAQIYQLLDKDRTILEPGYNQDEVFDDQFERRAREIQRTPGASQGLPIIPSKQGPWTGNNQLGIEREFAADSNNRQTILKLDEWDFPDVWTICLGMNDFTPTQGGFDVTALIQFGIGGVTQVVEVDWLNGSGISLPMNALNVVAQYNFIDGEVPGSPPSDLRLRVSISKLPSQNLRPTRSYWFRDGVQTIEIPPFAKAVHLAPIPDIGNPFDFYSVNAAKFSTRQNTIGHAGISLAQMSQFVSYIDFTNEFVGAASFYPIPPFARFINFVDVPAGSDVTVQCVAQFLIGL